MSARASASVTAPAGETAAAKRRTREGSAWIWLLVPMAATLALVFVVPIVCLLLLSLHSMTGPAQVSSEFTIENYWSFFTDAFYLKVLLNTLQLGTIVVLCCLVIGYPVSYFLARGRVGAACCSSW